MPLLPFREQLLPRLAHRDHTQFPLLERLPLPRQRRSAGRGIEHQNSLPKTGAGAITRLVREVAHVGVTQSISRPPQTRAAGQSRGPVFCRWLSTTEPQTVRRGHGPPSNRPARGAALVVTAGALVEGAEGAVRAGLITIEEGPHSSPVARGSARGEQRCSGAFGCCGTPGSGRHWPGRR